MTRKTSLGVAVLLSAITLYWIALPTLDAEPKPKPPAMVGGELGPSAGAPRSNAALVAPRHTPLHVQQAPAEAPAPTLATRATASPEDEDDRAEDEAMAADDNNAEQRVWRATWARERQDDAWTQQLHDEVQRIGRSVVEGDLKYYDLSCRETVCRVYLQFSDQLDAQAFMKAPRDSGAHYEFQSMDPEYTGEGYDRSDFSYELLVVRTRPDGLPARERSEPADDEAVMAEQTSETPEGQSPGEVIVRAQPRR
jgi:hypothetical protein